MGTLQNLNYTRAIIIVLIFCIGIRRADAQVITTISGPGNKIHTKNDQVDILPTITNASGVAVDDHGNVYVAEYWESTELLGSIFKFDPADTSNMRAGVITKGKNIPPPSGHIPYPHGVALDPAGNIYVAGYYSHTALKITPGGRITTVAGCGEPGYSGDNGIASAARLTLLNGIAVDRDGNIYIADEFNNVIRKVTPGGIITTFAGTGAAGYKGDGRPATHSLLNRPYGVTIDKAGNLLFSDTYNHVVRAIGPDGNISTIAGNGKEGYSGDHGPATDARLNLPAGITTDNSGNIYVADEGNNVVRKIAVSGVITTIAGNGSKGYDGDGGQAENASLSGPRDVAIDQMGNMYIADFGNHVIRKVVLQLPFHAAPVKILPLVTLPVTIIQMPLAFSQPISSVLVFITPSPMPRLPLLATVPLPVHVPSIIPSPPLATIAPVIIQRPLASVEIPLLTTKKISVSPPVIPSPPLAAIPPIVSRKPEVSWVTMPVLSVIPLPVNIPFVVTASSPVAIPPTTIHTRGIILVKLPLLPAKVLPGTLPVAGGAASSAFVVVPPVVIQVPAAKIPILSSIAFPVSFPFPDTLQQLVEIPVVDIPQPEEIPPPPPQNDEDKVTVSISADNTMTITSEKGSYTSFTITSMLGETIIEEPINAKQTSVKVTTLPPGNYYINLKSDKDTKTLRFVKEN